jgi:probable H4MPT-linked C1 transfer pathway protein
LTHERSVVGWDIGGVNTKVARVAGGRLLAVRGRPFELQRAPETLVPLLRELATEVSVGSGRGEGAAPEATTHAVTMTAELSQMFRTKRDGVAFVLDAVTTAFPFSAVRVFTVDGRFVAVDEARQRPLAVAAANWAATAHAVARHHPDALLVDIGTTSTDIIPIVAGAIVAAGRTDPERLASGELVYTGAVRTPAEAIASHVPLGDTMAGASAEGFALAGDVHVWRGSLAPADYTSPTPDGRVATREFAGERLARVVCADREMLDEAGVSAIADALATAQVQRVTAAIRRVVARHPSLRTAVVTGLGAFIADQAARAAGLQVVPLSSELGDAAARCAPAVAVALLLEAESVRLKPDATGAIAGAASGFSTAVALAEGVSRTATHSSTVVDTVVKLGGGVLARPEHFDAAVAAIAAASREHRVLVVPGGGPFADAVRDADRRLGIDDATAHWMAVLAMDQYAHLIASRLSGGVLVTDAREIADAIGAGHVPILAPYRWLRAADPLPHSWDVTSDSIAAWLAGSLGVRRLIVVKPAGASGRNLVDDYFERALPAGVTPVVVAADQLDDLRLALRGCALDQS